MLKIIIAEDHGIFRSSLVKLLSDEGVGEIIHQASNGIELLNYLENYTPDLILMDIEMPKMDGIEATNKIIEKYPDIKILMLLSSGDEQYYYKMIEAGAKGFVLKNGPLQELKNAIKIIAEGGSWFSPLLLENIVADINKNDIPNKLQEINKMELDVLKEICQGYNYETISNHLKLSKEEVNKHVQNLLTKTNSTNNSGLVLFAIKHKLIEI